MKIYAVKDRLLDFYMTPFAAPGDKEVLSGIATMINNGDSKDALAQAPHHFEIWCIGIVAEGHVIPERELIATCESLIRPGREATKPGDSPDTAAARRGRGPQGGPRGNGDPRASLAANAAPAGSGEG